MVCHVAPLLAKTGVKVVSKPAEIHLPLAKTEVKVVSKLAEIHLPLAKTGIKISHERGLLVGHTCPTDIT